MKDTTKMIIAIVAAVVLVLAWIFKDDNSYSTYRPGSYSYSEPANSWKYGSANRPKYDTYEASSTKKSSSTSSSKSSSSKNSSSKKSTKDDDPYDAKSYAHPDDLYYDYPDDFWDYEDAEEYWEDHND